MIHLLIAIQRVKKQFTMEPPTEALTALIETDAFRVAQAIAVEVEQHDDIAFPISETMFIALHLLSAKKVKKLKMIMLALKNLKFSFTNLSKG